MPRTDTIVMPPRHEAGEAGILEGMRQQGATQRAQMGIDADAQAKGLEALRQVVTEVLPALERQNPEEAARIKAMLGPAFEQHLGPNWEALAIGGGLLPSEEETAALTVKEIGGPEALAKRATEKHDLEMKVQESIAKSNEAIAAFNTARPNLMKDAEIRKLHDALLEAQMDLAELTLDVQAGTRDETRLGMEKEVHGIEIAEARSEEERRATQFVQGIQDVFEWKSDVPLGEVQRTAYDHILGRVSARNPKGMKWSYQDAAEYIQKSGYEPQEILEFKMQ